MAKSNNSKPSRQERRDNDPSVDNGGDAPFAGDVKSPDVLREPTVSTPEGSFHDRTGVAQPWMTEDGKQDNGQENLDEVYGARGGATREGSSSTVEETDKAIDEGIVEGPQDKSEL